jgi:hypothetical protein
MFHRPFALTRASRRIAFAAVLLVSLVLVQALGLMHGIAHMRHAPGAAVTTTATSTESGWVAKLFAGHQHGGDCDVYDQLSHGDALHAVAPVVAAIEFVQTPVALHRGWHIATQSSGFLARGPPSLS